MKNLKLILAILVFGFSAWASGLITVKGKLISITPTEYAVETPASIYYINRSAVSPITASKITRTGVTVSIPVSFEGIDLVKQKTTKQ